MVTTVTTVTTVTAIAALGIVGAISIAATVMLVAFLTTKELASVSRSGASLRIAKFVNVGIVPLVITFGVMVLVTILQIVG